MAERRTQRERTAEEQGLEPWFAAARAEVADPPLALLSAILADAASVGAAREVAVPPAREVPAEVVPLPQAGGGWRFDLVGGWKGLAGLAACAAVGFWIGMVGEVTVEDGAVWSGARAVAADSAPDDPVGAFFDLASAEG